MAGDAAQRWVALLGRLSRPIPAPYRPPPKPRAQWNRLKPGDTLQTVGDWALGPGARLTNGDLVTVTHCDEVGVTLAHVSGRGSFRFEEPTWARVFRRPRKPRAGTPSARTRSPAADS